MCVCVCGVCCVLCVCALTKVRGCAPDHTYIRVCACVSVQYGDSTSCVVPSKCTTTRTRTQNTRVKSMHSIVCRAHRFKRSNRRSAARRVSLAFPIEPPLISFPSHRIARICVDPNTYKKTQPTNSALKTCAPHKRAPVFRKWPAIDDGARDDHARCDRRTTEETTDRDGVEEARSDAMPLHGFTHTRTRVARARRERRLATRLVHISEGARVAQPESRAAAHSCVLSVCVCHRCDDDDDSRASQEFFASLVRQSFRFRPAQVRRRGGLICSRCYAD